MGWDICEVEFDDGIAEPSLVLDGDAICLEDLRPLFALLDRAELLDVVLSLASVLAERESQRLTA